MTDSALRLRLASRHGTDARHCLSQRAERELVLAAKRGEGPASDDLVQAFLPSVAAVARRYRRAGIISHEELMQEGVAGLLCALQRYETDRDTPFWAYAVWWVRQAMQHLTAQLTGPVVLSDRALRQLARVKGVRRAYEQRYAAEPTIGELASDSGVSRPELERLLVAGRAARPVDESFGGETGDALGDMLPDPAAEEAYDRALRHADIDQMRRRFQSLGAREQMILDERFGLHGDPQTLREVASRLGISAERVRQIEKSALAQLEGEG